MSNINLKIYSNIGIVISYLVVFLLGVLISFKFFNTNIDATKKYDTTHIQIEIDSLTLVRDSARADIEILSNSIDSMLTNLELLPDSKVSLEESLKLIHEMLKDTTDARN